MLVGDLRKRGVRVLASPEGLAVSPAGALRDEERAVLRADRSRVAAIVTGVVDAEASGLAAVWRRMWADLPAADRDRLAAEADECLVAAIIWASVAEEIPPW